MGMAAPVYYTADMVRALPDDGNRYETVHGELLVTPSPRAIHQYVAGELFARLHQYLKQYPLGLVFASPADISWAPDVLVQPDVFVVDRTQAATMDWVRMRSLLLAVEVLSPSTRRQDRFAKRRVYQENGVATYWVVDPQQRSVETWQPDSTFPVVEHERVTWEPAGSSEPLVIELASIFPSSS